MGFLQKIRDLYYGKDEIPEMSDYDRKVEEFRRAVYGKSNKRSIAKTTTPVNIGTDAEPKWHVRVTNFNNRRNG